MQMYPSCIFFLKDYVSVFLLVAHARNIVLVAPYLRRVEGSGQLESRLKKCVATKTCLPPSSVLSARVCVRACALRVARKS